MPVMVFPKGALITFAGTTLSDHGRTALEISPDWVQKSERTITGTMKRQAIAYKRKYSFSWDMLPALSTQTVDGFAGRNALRDLVTTLSTLNTNYSVLQYKEVNNSNQQVTTSVNVFIEDYSDELLKRWQRQYWKVSLSLVEV